MYTPQRLSSRYRKFIYKFSMWPAIVAVAILLNMIMFFTFTHFAPDSQGADITMRVTTGYDLNQDGDGVCSLREAIRATQLPTTTGFGCVTDGGAVPQAGDTLIIELPSSTYFLNEDDGFDEDLGRSGDLDLATTTYNILFQHEVPGTPVAIDAGFITDRVLDVRGDNPDRTVTFNNIFFDGGRVTDVNTGGGGVRLREAGNVVFTGGGFRNNKANISMGGGLSVEGTGSVTIDGTLFQGNSAQQYGGGLSVSTTASSLIVQNATFETNTSTERGAGMFVDGVATITNTTFTSNTASGLGAGGLYIQNTQFAPGTTALSNVTFDQNVADDLGAGMVAGFGANVTMNAVTFDRNDARSVTARASGLYVSPNAVVNATGGSFTNHVLPFGTDTYGAAALVEGTATFTGTTFTNNQSKFGAAVATRLNGSLTLRGGSMLNNNQAAFGGALYAENATLSLNNVEMHTNSSTDFGGAIYANSSNVLLEQSYVHTNTSGQSGVSDRGDGAAIYTTSVAANNNFLSITSSTLANNAAWRYAGAVYAEDVNVLAGNSTISGNFGQLGAGGFYLAGQGTPQSEIDHTTFALNSGAQAGAILASSTAQASIRNSILVQNQETLAGEVVNCFSQNQFAILSTGGNIEQIQDATQISLCNTGVAGDFYTDVATTPTASILNTTLQTFGTLAPIHALIGSGPAVNLVPTTTLFVDARGLARPAGPQSDAGAFEFYPMLSATDSSVMETATGTTSTIIFTVTLSESIGAETVITYDIVAGTASGFDVVLGTGLTTVIPAGQTTGEIYATVIGDDEREQTETFTIQITDATNALVADGTAVGTILDDDFSPVRISQQTFTGEEGVVIPAAYTVVLDVSPQPGEEVTLVAFVTPNGAVSTTPGIIRFDDTNFDTPQQITLSIADDDLVNGNRTSTIQYFVNSTDNTSQFDNAEVMPIVVNIQDNDKQGIQSETTSITINEGTAGTIDFRLTAEPTNDVTVRISDTADYTVDPEVFTFTPANWNDLQQIFLQAVPDTEIEDPVETFQLEFTLETFEGGNPVSFVADQTIEININDQTAPGLTFSTNAVTVSEDNGTSQYTIQLSAQPTDNVNISLALETGEATVSPNTLQFTPGNWNQAQQITVTATADAIDEDTQNYTIQHQTSSNDPQYGFINRTVALTVEDNDTAGITVTPAVQTVIEGGQVQYTVVLDSQPTQDTTVSISGALAEMTLSTQTVNFTSLNWNTAQTVTVNVDQNNAIDGQRTATLTHQVTAGDARYLGGAITEDMVLTINDDDVGGISQNPASLTLSETNGIDSVTFRLTAAPSDTVTITAVPPSSDVALDRTSVTFTTANWETAQSIQFTAINDQIAEGEETVTVSYTATSNDNAYDNFALVDTTITILDDDTAGITLTPGSVTVSEGGVDQTYTISIDTQPTDTVTVDLSFLGSDIEVTPAQVTFVPGGQGGNPEDLLPKQVTVRAIDDADIENTETVSIVHRISSPDTVYNALADEILTATVIDNDSAAVLITIPGGSLDIDEGQIGSYTLQLTEAPANGEVVTIDLSETSDQLDIVTPLQLTFTDADFNIPKTVEVQTLPDDIDELDLSVTITQSVTSNAPNYQNVSADPVIVTILDNDTAGFMVNTNNPAEPGTIRLTEGEVNPVVYTMRLTSQPTDDVVVALASDSLQDYVLSQTEVTFTSLNWDEPQTIGISPVDDAEVEDTERFTISEVATSNDPNYDGRSPNPATAVEIIDNDGPGVLITPQVINVSEGDQDGMVYTVVLASQPTTFVRVNPFTASSQVTMSTSSILFTSLTWDQPVQVRVVAVDDGIAEADLTAQIDHGVVSGPGSEYDALPAPSVTVNIADNDTSEVVFSLPSPYTLEEGDSQTVDVALGSEPTGEVTVVFSGSEDDITFGPVSMVFDPTNYTTAQTFTINATDDTEDEPNELVNITVNISSATDLRYDALANQTIGVNVIDNDTTPVDPTPIRGGGGGGGGGGALPPSLLRPAVDGTVLINNGAETTTSPNVTLTLNGNGAALMAISNTPNFEGVIYEGIREQVAWTLPEGPGLKSVYVRFRSTSGAISEAYDTITLTGDTPVIDRPLPEIDLTPAPLPTIDTCAHPVGSAVKSPNSSSVYYITSDCQKKPFYNEISYFCYFDSFDVVDTISDETLASIPDARGYMQCDAITFDVFIVNPNGSTVFSNDSLRAKKSVDAQGIGTYDFDDSGADLDFNDVNTELVQTTCDTLELRTLRVDASWQHDIYVRVMNDRLTDDLLIWDNSHLARNTTAQVDISDYVYGCE